MTTAPTQDEACNPIDALLTTQSDWEYQLDLMLGASQFELRAHLERAPAHEPQAAWLREFLDTLTPRVADEDQASGASVALSARAS